MEKCKETHPNRNIIFVDKLNFTPSSKVKGKENYSLREPVGTMSGAFSASVLQLDLDDAALEKCNAFLNCKSGFSCFARIVLGASRGGTALSGEFAWPPEGNDGCTLSANVLNFGNVSFEYPTYGPRPEAKGEPEAEGEGE